MKQLIRRTLRRAGLELRRVGFRRDVMDFIENREIDLVLDVGGNVGQFGGDLRERGYRGRIVSFEPVRSVYQILASKAAADGNWEANNFALGEKTEQTTINVADTSVYSSILRLTAAAAQYDVAAIATHPEVIEVRKLDDVAAAMSGNMLLKIDTQGYERQVLQGGQHVLPLLKGVLMELPIVHLYEGTWKFYQAVEFMDSVGFIPAQIHPVNFHSADAVSLVEVDCLFRPRDSSLD